ncbi:MAG TPA: LamG-like jellyroll fold domain-containing protein [Sedimentisphaerales bacterium]|nr:LamG-like jellyroll fold domain-containing protein [Sedimentisphaerales bacterium]
MLKKCSCLALLAGILALALGGAAQAGFNPLKDPAIIGWWTCDEGAGEVVADSSPLGRDGRFVNGAPVWRTGVYGNAITLNGPTLVQIPAMGLTLSQATMAAWIFAPTAQPEWASFIMHRGPGPASGFNMLADRQLAYHWNDAANTWSYRPNVRHPLNEWAHCAVTVDPAKAVFYLNGVASATNTVSHPACAWDGPIYLGGDGGASWVARRMSGGSLDDVCFFSRAMTADEIQAVMMGLTDPALAGDPSPADEATDVPADSVLNWKAGETATSRDVYFGTSQADVTDATRANPKGVLVSQGQTATTFDPAGLAFGQTYYWRVDEVDAAGTILTGSVWSFTAEPAAYPIQGVMAKASSQSRADTGPENTVNGSGLANDQHSVNLNQMWMSSDKPLPNWIQYEFDKVYKIAELWVWNSNQVVEPFVGFGAKSVKIEYSTDGVTWSQLDNVPQFNQATGTPTYAANTIVDFAGATAKFVKLTINTSWGGIVKQSSLSEVRFFYKPVQAREPVPADGAEDVLLTASLDWRPGREATSHKVFFGTDEAAVAAGTAAASTVSKHGYTPSSMTFGTQYFWRVDEVGAATYEGNVWSFTSQEFAPIDDFEGYTDSEGSRIYEFWFDGIADAALGGSTVGYMEAPFAERTVVHAGKQAMPFAYDNTKTPFFSEAVKEFGTNQNWTGSGATELSVWTRGRAALASTPVTEAGGKMTLTGAGVDIWGNSDDFTYAYKTLTGDGSLVARVTSNGTGTNTWAKGGVMIRDSVNGGSMHAMMVITGGGGNGASFQYRSATNGASGNNDSTAVVAPPYWVRIERAGGTFSGYVSADGKTWSVVGQTVVEMTDPVLIGLCVTSHVAGVDRTFQFESIAATGNVTGAWQGAIINAPVFNDAAPMYLTVTDSAGKSATATSDTAVTAADWTRWTIPMSSFSGVNFTRVKKLTIGIGAKGAASGGSGIVFIDDIGFGRSVPAQP